MSTAAVVPVASFLLVVLFIVLIVRLVHRASKRPVVWPGAAVGVATVTSVRSATPAGDGRTRAVIEVAVEPQYGTPFPSVLTRTVPSTMVGYIQPGLRFPAMYRRGRFEKVKIARGEPEPRARQFFDQVRVRDGLVTPEMLEAQEHGVRVAATVLGVRPTGVVRGGLPEYEFGLRLRTVTGETVEVTKRQPLLGIESTALRPGATLPARVIPRRPDSVVMAFSRRRPDPTRKGQ